MGIDLPDIQALSRDDRQKTVSEWCGRTFGAESQQDRKKRALRLLEEAIELYQAEGGTCDQAVNLVTHVFARPAGEPAQEVGGVAVTLLSYCAAAGLSADGSEAAEIARVLNKPAAQAQQRYLDKTEAGF